MSKFKYINKKGQVSVALRLVSNESINTGMAGYLAGNYIKGFLRPAADKGGGIIYSGAQGMALSQFLRRPVNKEQFYIIIAHLLEAYKMIVSVNLDPSMIVLEPDYITISENTGDIHLVYQPIINSQSPNQGFMRCFGQICSMLKYASPQDQASIGGFIAFARTLPAFSVSEIERYILSAAPGTYNIVMRMPFSEPMGAPAPVAAEPPMRKPSMTDSSPVETVLASNELYAAPTELKYAQPRSESPSISDFSPKNDVYAPQAEPVTAPTAAEEPILPEITKEEAAVEIPAEPEPLLTAKLIRRSNGEVMLIDKETFVIGKERARVNGCVTGNNAVSRVHATIMLRSDGCYIVDNGSTNKTYINGTAIPPMTEIRLSSGDAVKLANEEFDFFTL